MKAQELQKKGREELEKILSKKRKQLTSLQLKLSAGQLNDHTQVRKMRKDIARILTVLNQ